MPALTGAAGNPGLQPAIADVFVHLPSRHLVDLQRQRRIPDALGGDLVREPLAQSGQHAPDNVLYECLHGGGGRTSQSLASIAGATRGSRVNASASNRLCRSSLFAPPAGEPGQYQRA